MPSPSLPVELAQALQANRLPPKFLYATPRQAQLWKQVAAHHAPLHHNPDFHRMYEASFVGVAQRLNSPAELALVGLGCGTGQKEEQLYRHLRSSKREIPFFAVDVSGDLVRESCERLKQAGAPRQQGFVCDWTDTALLRNWLNEQAGSMPRLITFFGMVPNLLPPQLSQLLHEILRPDDILLASVHLVPVENGGEDKISSGMHRVLPQYDNPETMAWLNAALETWNVEKRVHPPKMTIGAIEGVPAFIGAARWRIGEQPLQLFYSLRYTLELFKTLLQRIGLAGEQLAITNCREEAVWCIRRG